MVERALDSLPENDHVAVGVGLARQLIGELVRTVGVESLIAERPHASARTLQAIRARRPDGSVEKLKSPLIPLLDTTLLTNAPGEPRVGNQIQAEIPSADRIDVVMAFIRRSGITPFRDEWREGVYFAKNVPADLCAFTLDKTTGRFSPTTRYRDYAISRDLIHWESQSVIRSTSETGRRYQEHVRRNSQIILFARHDRDERAFYCLGPATYVSHESELPMSITWRLQHPLPGDLFASFAAACGVNYFGWRPECEEEWIA